MALVNTKFTVKCSVHRIFTHCFHQKRNVKGPPNWRSGLRHCIAVLEASLQLRVRSRALLKQAATGRPMGWRNIIRVRGVFGQLGCPCPIMLLWRPGACTLTSGRQLYGVSSDTLVRLASGLSEQCVKKQCGLAGRISKDA